ncbi:hypothetical protein DFJ43DRAFT_839911 [Lentinula guzmanii]|uniref:Uncharacterized protein n=1 Tax=Lentinula guzmanii TaxID=2804957 RepID=A0AA38J8G3_9AGAR|nr:hypothetical protein DFJ43DRAFT_839911 [Lentinula guzmanii]
MDGIVVAFDVIQAIGLIGALAIMTTAFYQSPSIRRLPTWYMILGSSATYSLSRLLLAMAHGQAGPEPKFSLCLVQSALIYSSPIWLLAATFAFALQFHLTLLYYVQQYTGKIHRDNKWLPISTPHIVQRNPEQFYCHFTNLIGVSCVSIFSVVFAIGSVVCEFKSGMLLYRHWKPKNDFFNQSNGQVSINVMIRLASFSFLSISSVATCVVYLLPITNFKIFMVYNAFLANVGILVLGLNLSIIRMWIFWKRKPVADGGTAV